MTEPADIAGCTTERLTVPRAARALGISVRTLRRFLRDGAPLARRGRRGRGGAALVDCEAIAAWRAARAASERNAEVLVRVLAADVPEIVADAMHEAFRHVDGPHKRAVAGVLAGAWFLVSAAMLDRLRREVPELADLTVLPEKISTLRHICAASGSLAPSFSKE